MGKYSKLKVMMSAAGYYIGTEYIEDDGFTMPGSRESGYYKTRDQAEKELKFYQEWERDD